MTQDSSTPAGSERDRESGKPPENPTAGSSSSTGGEPPAPRRKKRRILLWGFLGLVGLIILVVILAPTIACTGVVRELIVSRVNSSALNGRLEIKDWSLGWTSGVRLDGVQLSDPQNRVLIQVGQVTTGLTLLNAVRGNLDLGNVEISGLNINAVRNRAGEINLKTVVKPSPAPAENPPPSKLPNIKGVVHIDDSEGNTFQDDVSGITTVFAIKKTTLTIADINQPIKDSGEIEARLMNQAPGTVRFDGEISAVQNNLVDVEHLAGSQTAELSAIDLKTVSGFLRTQKIDLKVAGILNGKIAAQVKTLHDMDAHAALVVADPSFDTAKYKQLKIDVNGSRKPSAGGEIIKLDMPIVATSPTTQPDQIAVHIAAPEDALRQLQAVVSGGPRSQAAPGAAAADVQIFMDVGVGNLANQLRDTLHVQPNTTLTGGRLTAAVKTDPAAAGPTLNANAHLRGLTGTRDGTNFKVTDIDTTARVVAGATADQAQLSATVISSFMNLTAAGQGLARADINGSLDLKNLQHEVAQFIDLNGLLHAPPGTQVVLAGTGTFHAATSGNPAAVSDTMPVAADLKLSNLTISGISSARPISQPSFTAAFAGNVQKTATEFVHAVRNLKLTVQSPAIALQITGEVVKVGGGWEVPAFDVSPATVDLHVLQDEMGGALAMIAGAPKPGEKATLLQAIGNGTLNVASGKVTIAAKGKVDAGGYSFDTPATVHIDPISLSAVNVAVATIPSAAAATAQLPVMDLQASPGSGAGSKTLNIKATIGTAADALFTAEMSTDALGKAAGAATTVDVPHFQGDLARLQAAFAPVLPILMPGASGENIAKLAIKSGTLSGSARLQRGTGDEMISIPDISIAHLSVTNYFEDQSIKLAAEASLKPDGSAMQATKLNGDFGFAKLALYNDKPFEISGLDNPQTIAASGGITLSGDVARTMRFVEAFTGAAPNTYKYTGQYAFNETLGKDPQHPQVLAVAGGGSVTSFAVLSDGPTPALTENEIAIDNSCQYQLASKTLVIDPAHPISVAMKSSGALTMNLGGTVADVGGKQDLNASLMLDYDLAKLWIIIKPMLTAAQQQTYADLKITGRQKRTFVLGGSYPHGLPFNQAITSVKSYGAFQIDTFDYAGIGIQNFELPILLQDGILITKYGPDGQAGPKPAACNGGTIDLGLWRIALNTAVMRLALINADPQHPHQMLKGVSLNPALSQSILSSVLNNPAFSGAQTSKGLLDLSILQCQGIPLSELATEENPANKGVAKIVYSIHGLQMGSTLLQMITQKDSVAVDISDAQVTLQGGRVTQDTTLMVDGNKPIHMYGVVILKTRQFAPMTIDLSTALLGPGIVNDRNLAQYLPDQISLPLEGDMKQPHLNLNKAVTQMLQSAAEKAATARLTDLGRRLGGATSQPAGNGPAGNGPASTQPSGQPKNPLEDILRGLIPPKK